MFRQSPYDFLYALSPELETIDSQIMFASDGNPATLQTLQTNLVTAQATLAQVDKTNVNAYIGAMQQVLMLRNRINSSNITRESLLQQKATILAGLIAQN